MGIGEWGFKQDSALQSPRDSGGSRERGVWISPRIGARAVIQRSRNLSAVHLLWQHVFLSCRRCALVALQDVKAYLLEECGQIAVRLFSAKRSVGVYVCAVLSCPGHLGTRLKPGLFGAGFKAADKLARCHVFPPGV